MIKIYADKKQTVQRMKRYGWVDGCMYVYIIVQLKRYKKRKGLDRIGYLSSHNTSLHMIDDPIQRVFQRIEGEKENIS